MQELRRPSSSSSIQFQSGFLLVPEGGRIHLIPSAIALTPSLHLVRSPPSSIFNPTFFTFYSTCLLHVSFARPRFNSSTEFAHEHSWRSEWNNCNTRLHHFTYNIDTPPPDMHLPRRSWVRLNHPRTGVGRFRSSLLNWGMVPYAACDCGAENQTAEHILAHCPLFSPPHGITGLVRLGDDTITWLHESCPDI